jgi:hypothetical protein
MASSQKPIDHERVIRGIKQLLASDWISEHWRRELETRLRVLREQVRA